MAGGASGDAGALASEGTVRGVPSLPHLDRIQNAFGARDGTNVQAYGGSRAAATTTSGAPVQREEVPGAAQKAGAAPEDDASPAGGDEGVVLVVLLIRDGFDGEARLLAREEGIILKPTTTAQLRAGLTAIHRKISVVHLIAHGTESGDLVWRPEGSANESREKHWNASRLEAAIGEIPAAFAPDQVQIRACNVGDSKAGMEGLGGILGSGDASVFASTCFVVTHQQGPVEVGRKEIRTRAAYEALSTKDKATFDQGFQAHMAVFSGRGIPQSALLEGGTREAYFAAGGYLIAKWLTPEHTTDWDAKDSRAWNAAWEARKPFVETSGEETLFVKTGSSCKIVEVEMTPEGGGAGGAEPGAGRP